MIFRFAWLPSWAAAICLAGVAPSPSAGTEPPAGPTAAAWADDFVGSVGVNVHWADDRGLYNREYEKVKAKLAESGIRHVRDGALPNAYRRGTDLYHALGVRTTFIHGVRVNDGVEPHWKRPLDVAGIPGELAATRAGVPVAAIGAIEGPNEYDIFHDGREKDWAGKLRDFQRELFKRVRAEPAFKDVPVVGPSVTTHEAAAKVGDLSAAMDFGCGHFYRSTRPPGSAGWGGGQQFPPYGGGTYGSMDYCVAATRQMCGRKPLWSTETGYATHRGGVSEAVQGKYLPRLVAEFYRLGIRKTFKYEMLDERDDPKDDQANFGLLRYDLTEKPAFTALENLLGLLKDNSWDAAGKRWSAPAFTPGALNYRLTGDVKNVRSVLLQKRDGDFYLLLWQEVADPTFHHETWQPKYERDVPVTLTVTTPVRSGASVHVLTADGTMSKSAATVSGGTLSLSVPDRVMVVRLTPVGGKP